MTWRVIWTPLNGTFPNYADWDYEATAQYCANHLEADGITDATIHNLGDTK